MIKVGIYDRYLSTLGGGERYSCKIAEILSRKEDYSVDLITDIYVDLEKLSTRLNLDLSKVNLKFFPFVSEAYATKITANYDIFINATYLSHLPAYGKRNIYLCYFPTPFDVDFRFIHRFLLLFFRFTAVWLFRVAEKWCSHFRDIEIEKGLYEPKRFLLGRGSWSSGRVVINVKNVGNLRGLRLGFKNPATSPLDEMDVKLEVVRKKTGELFLKKELSIPKFTKQVVKIFGNYESYKNGDKNSDEEKDGKDKESDFYIIISSNTFVPSSIKSSSQDTRRLGVVVYNETETGFIKKIILKILGFIPLFLIDYPKDLKFLETYNKIITISEFSQGWIKRLWEKESTILYPPVEVNSFKADKKEKIILSVGRFFPEHHNKKQFELAKVFIELVKGYSDIMNDYWLYLVGGVDQRKEHLEYVEKIKSVSKNYPIKVLTNVSWDRLVEIFSKSMIFWHAAGMGENEERDPYKFEHFGITTVEAMASGCIPVVINKGGQKEIIKDGEDGFLFNSWEELKKITLNICSGRVDIEKIRKKAIENCQRFSTFNFEKNLLCIIGEEVHGLKLSK